MIKDREKWTKGKESMGYKAAYTIFNEYMNWSGYLLYCYETLLKLYSRRSPDRTVADLYPDLLN